MKKTIEFTSMETRERQKVVFTVIYPGEPIGHGVEGVAKVGKVVCQAIHLCGTDGKQKVNSVSTIARVSGLYPFAPFVGATICKEDAQRLREWVRNHLTLMVQK